MIALILACCLSVPTEVIVDTDTVTLGAIVGFPAGDARAALPLGAAPNPGLGRSFLRQELIAKITTAGMSPDDIEFPGSVLVRRKSQGLDASAVSRLVQEAYSRQYPDADITIISVDTPAVDLATGPLQMTASLPDRADPSGPIYVKIDVRSPGFSRSIFVKSVAEVRKPQPTLRTTITANEEVHATDLEWKIMPVKGRGELVLATDKLEGLLAKRTLQAGEVLTNDLLYSPLLVHKGDAVTVRATNGGVSIAATMRAAASAHMGETILVEHLSGQGSTSARVIGPRLLETTTKGAAR